MHFLSRNASDRREFEQALSQVAPRHVDCLRYTLTRITQVCPLEFGYSVTTLN